MTLANCLVTKWASRGLVSSCPWLRSNFEAEMVMLQFKSAITERALAIYDVL